MKNSIRNLALFLEGVKIPLNGKKLIVGSADHCDIQLKNDSISHYHAIIFIGGETIEVMDLDSDNGIYINGTRITGRAPFIENDNLSFGTANGTIMQNDDDVEFEEQADSVQIYSQLQESKIYVPEKENDTDILIDGEYCNIIFNDDDHIPMHSLSFTDTVQIDSYIHLDDMEASFAMLDSSNGGNCIQITTALRHSVLEQSYFPLEQGTISSKIDITDLLTDIVKVHADHIELLDIDGFTASRNTMPLDGSEKIILSAGPYQIFIEVGNASDELLYISPLARDKSFFKDTGKKFASIVLPFLLLLLVDFSIEPPKKRALSIIYKRPTKSTIDGKTLASSKVNNTKKNTGHKTTKQPQKKISHSKSGAKAKKKVVSKKVAKAKAAPQKPTKKVKTKAKMKAYKFKMASNINSVFSTSKSVKVSNSRSPSSVKTTSKLSGSLNTSVTGTSSASVGNMGSDSSGASSGSFGSQGLSNKKGRDTAYIQTQTIVLGSMDPELLRKILQQYLPQFRHCYQQELAYNSEDIKGIVDLNFEITAGGRVGKIKVTAKDSRFSKKGTDCMGKVLAIIDFPKPKGGGRVAVRQPLSFFSEKERG